MLFSVRLAVWSAGRSYCFVSKDCLVCRISIRLAVWSAGRSCCFVSNDCLVCKNSQCCLVSDWLSGLQEDHVVLYQMAVWYAGILSVV